MNLLFDHFEHLTDAPHAVSKLRELILQLAVQGKLVPQDPTDEPASELLKRIKAEKARLIKEKKIKKQKPLPPIDPEEVPYELPDGWEWVRLNSIFNFIDYRGKTPKKTSCGVRLITAKNIRMGKLNRYPEEFISIETYKKWMTRGFPQLGDLLFTTEAPLANVAQVNLEEEFALAQRAINLQPFLKIDSTFLMYAMMSESIQSLILEKATGMTAKGIKAANLKLIIIPLPPLAEQKRIVAKVDQLMGLCDELEARQRQREEKRVHLNNASLNKLLDSPTPQAFQTHWQRIVSNFNDMYGVPENVTQLKQAILQLAVQGQLVPQDPTDEPASELLKRITAEKARLIKEKKIKKQKPLPPIDPEEVPYELPDGWVWCYLSDAGLLQRGKSKHRPRNDMKLFNKGIYPFVQTGDISRSKNTNFQIQTYTSKYNDSGLAQSKMWKCGTLCITIAANIAESGFLTFDACFPDSVVGFVSLDDSIISKYVQIFIMISKSQLETFAPSTAQKNINLGILNNMLLPFPPLAEQKRIVAKVDRLLALCDQLETQLGHSQEQAGRALVAVVAKTFQG